MRNKKQIFIREFGLLKHLAIHYSLLFSHAVVSQNASHNSGFCRLLRLHLSLCSFSTRKAAPIQSDWHHGHGMLKSTFFPFNKEKRPFKTNQLEMLLCFYFSTELPGTHYEAVRDVYLAMATVRLLTHLCHWSCHLG